MKPGIWSICRAGLRQGGPIDRAASRPSHRHTYLEQRPSLRHVFVLIDSRLDPQAIDLAFLQWLSEIEAAFSLIFTKADNQAPALKVNVDTFMKALTFCEPPESSSVRPRMGWDAIRFWGLSAKRSTPTDHSPLWFDFSEPQHFDCLGPGAAVSNHLVLSCAACQNAAVTIGNSIRNFRNPSSDSSPPPFFRLKLCTDLP